MRNPSLFLLIFVLCLLISAPADAAGKRETMATIKIESIYSGISGPDFGRTPGASWIADEKSLEALAAKFGRPVPDAIKKASSTTHFEQEGLLLIWMGQKPTGGYALNLKQNTAHALGDVAFLTLQWTQPDPGDMVIQMMTEPFLILRLEKANYRIIRILDQDGINRVELDMSIK